MYFSFHHTSSDSQILKPFGHCNTGSGRITRFLGLAFLICSKNNVFCSLVVYFSTSSTLPTGEFTQPYSLFQQTKTKVITLI